MLEKFNISMPTSTDSRNKNRISFFIIAVPYIINKDCQIIITGLKGR
jgi:hypothetical protein